MAIQPKTWCQRDEHLLFELYSDFNEWLESDDGAGMREENNIAGLSQPSKSFFAGAKESYDQAFQHLKQIKCLTHDLTETVPFCYTIRIMDNRRDEFMSFMKENGIGVSILYLPNHQQTYFRKYSCSLPITEKLGKEFVSIPLFGGMTDEEVDFVINKVKEFDSNTSR